MIKSNIIMISDHSEEIAILTAVCCGLFKHIRRALRMLPTKLYEDYADYENYEEAVICN